LRPEIKRYLDEYGARYTPAALRAALLEVGHDPAEVDAALQEWQSEHAGGAVGEDDRRTFRRWTIWLHLGALVAVFLALTFLNRAQPSGVGNAGFVAGFLGVLLLVGWYVSSLIGRALLPRTGIAVALIVPVISALGLGGSCLAIMGGLPIGQPAQPAQPATTGTMLLVIQPPLSFKGSGPATCQGKPGVTGLSVFAENLGTLNGAVVSVSIDAFQGGGDPNASPVPSGATETVILSVTLFAAKGDAAPQGYLSTPDTRLQVDIAADRLSGNVAFEALGPAVTGDPSAPAGRQPISGSVSWTCSGG
jgi:hypothetical protein